MSNYLSAKRISGQYGEDEGLEPLPLPHRAYVADAGMDLYAAEESNILYHGERELVRTGIALAIPQGWVGLVMPRSGLAAEHGVTVLNAPGVVDSGYRGEIKVNLINLGFGSYVARRGDRIAQIVFQRIETPVLVEVEELDFTDRGTNGHGSSSK